QGSSGLPPCDPVTGRPYGSAILVVIAPTAAARNTLSLHDALPIFHGEDAVIRILDKEQINEEFRNLNLDVVGFAEEDLRKFRHYIAEPYGMVLVTGPTGSGKTTTLYAALNEIRNEEDKIVTIEDPVEYQLHGIKQIP